MKRLFILGCVLAIACSFSYIMKQKYVVRGMVTSTSSYCGGAAPSEEMLTQYKTPKPLGGKKLYIRKGNMNNVASPVVAEVVSDVSGKFSVSLPKGVYSVVGEEKKDKSHHDQLINTYSKGNEYQTPIDKVCLDKWLSTPDYSFEVKKNTDIVINFHIGCNWHKIPCSQYTGPLPP